MISRRVGRWSVWRVAKLAGISMAHWSSLICATTSLRAWSARTKTSGSLIGGLAVITSSGYGSRPAGRVSHDIACAIGLGAAQAAGRDRHGAGVSNGLRESGDPGQARLRRRCRHAANARVSLHAGRGRDGGPRRARGTKPAAVGPDQSPHAPLDGNAFLQRPVSHLLPGPAL